MNPRFVGALMLIIIIACAAAGVIVYPQLPATIVSHWSMAGHANGTMGKFWGVFVVPLIMLVLVGVWALLPRIDPIARGFKGFRRVYDFSFFLIIAFLAYVYALLLAVNLGLQLSVPATLLPGLAVLIFVLGALLPRLKRNWFFGIRTPWTLSSDTVWHKTHQLGSWLLMIAALCILAGAFVPRTITLWLVLVPVISAILISVVYSYILFQSASK